MVKVKKVGILSLANILGILYAILGFIFGVFASMISFLGIAFGEPEMGLFGALFGMGAIILLPIFYGAIGWIGGIVTAFLYNLITKWIGGLEIEVETEK
jgi:hypothetical protein